jgi:MFS transporter, putative metabolite:H+ symporter
LFSSLKPGFGYINAGAITGVIVMTVSIAAVVLTEETFGKDLDFIEM